MIPDKECLDESILSANLELIFKIICYKINPDKDTFNKMCNKDIFGDVGTKTRNEITELLIKNGLQVTYQEIESLIKYKSYLDNLERFGIPYDEKLYFTCFKYNYFPKSYDDKWQIDKNVLKLRKMCEIRSCGQTKVEQIRKFMKGNNLKLDRYCVDNAFTAGSTQLCRYMYEILKCEPTLFTFVRTAKNGDEYLQELGIKLIEKSGISYTEMCKVYDHIDLNNLPENKSD
jgi:hypothetical protein